jgi:hypothetical protein
MGGLVQRDGWLSLEGWVAKLEGWVAKLESLVAKFISVGGLVQKDG